MKLTPSTVLIEYRRQASPEILDEVKRFNALPQPLQLELLFYMIMHLTSAVGQIQLGQPIPPKAFKSEIQ